MTGADPSLARLDPHAAGGCLDDASRPGTARFAFADGEREALRAAGASEGAVRDLRMEMVGPVGRGSLEPYAYDKATMVKLWQRSEEETGFHWAV